MNLRNLTRCFLLWVMTLLTVFSCADRSSDTSHKKNKSAKYQRKILSESEKEKFITPTIYYTPDYSDTQRACAGQSGTESRFLLKLSKAETVEVSTCTQILKDCAMQGSCFIQYNNEKILINYHKKLNSQIQFMKVNQSLCPFGLGDSKDRRRQFKTMCLDPFYSVAADTDIHPLGSVIFIRALVGTQLPSGELHDGYFVVRDSGGHIKGRGRFDFFTGYFGLTDENPFVGLGLGGGSHFEYIMITGGEADQVRKRRLFPLLVRPSL